MNKTVKKIFTISLIFIILIYFIGVVYFSFFTFPNTSVNGIDRSFTQKKNVFDIDNKNYNLNIKGRDDRNALINGAEINLISSIESIPNIEQNIWLWPTSFFTNHKYKVKYENEYDLKKVEEILESKLLTNMIEPKNAFIKKVDDKYIIEDEVIGNKLDKDKLINSVKNSIENHDNELVLEIEYIDPTIKKDSPKLISDLEKMNKLATKTYIFDFKDRKWELTGEELVSMYDENSQGYELNKVKLRDYVKKIAIETDTYNTEREFNATGIGKITVPGGIYGWQMNVDKTVENLISMINSNKDGKVEIKYNMEALYREKDDIGNTYIEIDLSRQHMWFYKNGSLVIDTPIVSGYGRDYRYATPTGVNKVRSRERNRNLKGRNRHGNNYVYPVKYWIPVGWTGSGIHDSYDRTRYGNQVYLSVGGSSCINTPESAMKVIFENVKLETPVVIYESSTKNSPTEFEKQEMIRTGKAD